MSTAMLIAFFVVCELGSFVCGFVLGRDQRPYDAASAAERYVEQAFEAAEREDAYGHHPQCRCSLAPEDEDEK